MSLAPNLFVRDPIKDGKRQGVVLSNFKQVICVKWANSIGFYSWERAEKIFKRVVDIC